MAPAILRLARNFSLTTEKRTKPIVIDLSRVSRVFLLVLRSSYCHASVTILKKVSQIWRGDQRLQLIVLQVCGLKWSPDHQHLASGGNDNKVGCQFSADYDLNTQYSFAV